ncbi:MAG: o-succinylbenzoate synthase [Candidatus Paceibacteria bacterium]
MKAHYKKHILEFKMPSGTSRGILKTKETWFIILEDEGGHGFGECGMLRGLSIDDRPDYEERLQWVCANIHLGMQELYAALTEFPSIQIGVEMAFMSLQSDDPFQIYPSAFSKGEASIAINGLIWMGDKAFMKQQISVKLKQEFRCIKMKIGAIDFDTELTLLKNIRQEFPASEIEIRVDANGAFSPQDALEKLKRLSDFELHSIEQPIAPKQWDEMAILCKESPLDIALDEELIGVFSVEDKTALLQHINPQYIILKPSFIGGFTGSDAWIDCAEVQQIKWWITSALESNVGLNAISQYTFTKNSTLPQGLGTGSLYTNNIGSPLEITQGTLQYNPIKKWKFIYNL